MIRIATYEKREAKRSKIETYTADRRLKYCGSMFFRFYTILYFSEFDCSIKKDGKELRKVIDTKILLALELVKFTTTECENVEELKWKPKKYRPKELPQEKYRRISYGDLSLVWGLVFDEKSEWNKELREIFKDSEYEDILNQKLPTSYVKFFKAKDYRIGNVNYKPLLAYLPKQMFVECAALILNCKPRGEDIRDTEILGYSRKKIQWNFRYALWEFSKNPSREEELLGMREELLGIKEEDDHNWGKNGYEWIEYYYEHKGNINRLIGEELNLETNKKIKLYYTSNGVQTGETWKNVMSGILGSLKK